MTFWGVFAAAIMAQAAGAVVFFSCGWIAGRLKRRRRERETAAAFQTPTLAGEAPRADAVGIAEVAGMGCAGHAPDEQGARPCPFCGHGEQTIARFDPKPGGPPTVEFCVACFTCGAYGPTRGHPEAAVDAWNAAAHGPFEESRPV